MVIGRRGRSGCAGRARRRTRLRAPRRARITVERGRGPVLGPVRDRVAVRGRLHGLHADLLRRRVARRPARPGTASAARRRDRRERLAPPACSVKPTLSRTEDQARPRPVLVGDDEHVVGRDRVAQRRSESGTTRSSAPRPRRRAARRRPRRRALAVAAHHQRAPGRLRRGRSASGRSTGYTDDRASSGSFGGAARSISSCSSGPNAASPGRGVASERLRRPEARASRAKTRASSRGRTRS